MAATITKGQTFSSTEQITNTKLHNLVDLATITGITNSEIATDAQIADSKLAQISTAGQVNGAAITALNSIPAGANSLPIANGGTGVTSYTKGDMLYASDTNVLSKLAKNTTATRYLSNTGTDNIPAWAQVNVVNGITGVVPVANLGTGTPSTDTYLRGDGSWQEISGTANKILYTSDDTFVAPAGVTKVFVTMCGGGGGGGGVVGTGISAGGGGGGGSIIKACFDVTPLSSYTVTVGAAGSAGESGADGGNGGTTTFNTFSVAGGSGGKLASGGDGAGGNGAAAGSGLNASGSTAGTIPKLAGGNGSSGNSNAYGGSGGGSYFGTGGVRVGAGAGNVGVGFGAGGSGACASSNTGGAGSQGFVLVEY